MNIMTVNFNKYNDLEDMVCDELSQADADYFIINGDNSIRVKIAAQAAIRFLYVGFSPLTDKDLNGIAYIINYLLSNDTELTIKSYDNEEHSFEKMNALALAIIQYFDNAQIGSTVYKTFEISEALKKNYLFLPGFIDCISPHIEFNKLIYSLYMTSLGACRFKNIDRNILISLRNETIFVKFNDALQRMPKFCPELSQLVINVDRYIRLARLEDIEAMLFYIALFINASVFNKNRDEYAISYLYLHRAVETALIFYYLFNGIIEIDEYDNLCFKGSHEKIKGVGDIFYDYIKGSKDNDVTNKLKKLIIIRNSSSLAHGFYIPAIADYDEMYVATKSFIDQIITSAGCKTYYDQLLNNLRPLKKDIVRDRINSYLTT